MFIEPSDRPYDIAIIGGGIAGAGIARDASLRGLSVILFEKNSFGSGTSGKSSKLIHGGIRYLELFWNELKLGHSIQARKNLGFVFASLREEKILRRIAPDLIEPLPLIIPVYKKAPRKPISIYIGVCLYFLLGLLAGNGRLPRIFLGKKSLSRALPELRTEGLCGGVMFWDSRTEDVGLVRATIASAARNGAQCLENAEVTAFEFDLLRKRYLVSARIPDGGTRRFFAKKLVNAAGPWIDKVRSMHGEKKDNYLSPVAGSHIEIQKFLPTSVILQAKDGRVFFAINHGAKTRVGTTEWHCPDHSNVVVPESDVDYLLGSLSHYFPMKNFTRQDILSADAGVRPLPLSPETSNPNAIPREHEIQIDSEGVLHVVGVKLTDHRRAAEDVVDRLLPDLIKPGFKRKSLTTTTPLNA